MRVCDGGHLWSSCISVERITVVVAYMHQIELPDNATRVENTKLSVLPVDSKRHGSFVLDVRGSMSRRARSVVCLMQVYFKRTHLHAIIVFSVQSRAIYR